MQAQKSADRHSRKRPRMPIGTIPQLGRPRRRPGRSAASRSRSVTLRSARVSWCSRDRGAGRGGDRRARDLPRLVDRQRHAHPRRRSRPTGSTSRSPRPPATSSPATPTESPTSSSRPRPRAAADPFSGDPVLVSAPDASLPQVPANGPSSHPIPSADGRYVAFLSAATNLDLGPLRAGALDQRVRARHACCGTTIRIDGANGEPLGNASQRRHERRRSLRRVRLGCREHRDTCDINNAPDGFIADLDANGDGTRGDVSSECRSAPRRNGVTDLVISGNGAHIAFTAHYPLTTPRPARLRRLPVPG